MTTITITTRSKAEAKTLAAENGGRVQRAGLLTWKAIWTVDRAVDLDAVAERARALGCDVTVSQLPG